MTDDKKASEYNIEGGSVLHLVLALRGGSNAAARDSVGGFRQPVRRSLGVDDSRWRGRVARLD